MILAFIPSTEAVQLALSNDQIPSAEWQPGAGTYEEVLYGIARRTVGQAISIDWAYQGPSGTIYLAKPLDRDAEKFFVPPVAWRGPRIGEIASHDSIRKYWQKFIIDIANNT